MEVIRSICFGLFYDYFEEIVNFYFFQNLGHFLCKFVFYYHKIRWAYLIFFLRILPWT
jgi:hypothetical protein